MQLTWLTRGKDHLVCMYSQSSSLNILKGQSMERTPLQKGHKFLPATASTMNVLMLPLTKDPSLIQCNKDRIVWQKGCPY